MRAIQEPCINEDELFDLGNFRQKEGVSHVVLGQDLSNGENEQLLQLLQSYSGIFSDVPGKTDVIEHTIQLTDNKPISSRPYPLPYAVRENLKEEIADMLQLGVIRESSSPYASPIVIVKKKDGSNRICVDYRKLNRVTITDPEPMSIAQDLFQKLGKSKFFSKIDLSKGYWQIPVAGADIHKTAFVTPDGAYEFLRTPFGMKNSGATLVRGMRKIFSGMTNVESYIDDLIIYNNDWDSHLATLNEVFQRLQHAKLTARPSKCMLAAKSVEFLGHSIGHDWITPSDDNLEKIRSAKRPSSKKEVRSFIGLLNYYRDFIPNFAAIAAPLTDLTKKGQPNKVIWEEAQEKAFCTLQTALLQKPILKLPDHQRQFVLRTDASAIGLGAVLLQEYEGKLHPVGFASKKLTAAEGRYSTLQKECLAIVWGITKFRLFLAGKLFVLQTDHKPLAYLNTAKYQNDKVMRWALALQEYEYHVRDIPGKDNHIADYLSRVMD